MKKLKEKFGQFALTREQMKQIKGGASDCYKISCSGGGFSTTQYRTTLSSATHTAVAFLEGYGGACSITEQNPDPYGGCRFF